MAKRYDPEALRRERFAVPYRVGKARMGLKEPDISAMIGVCEDTLRHHRNSPGNFTVRQLSTIGTALMWTDEDYLAVLFPERRTTV